MRDKLFNGCVSQYLYFNTCSLFPRSWSSSVRRTLITHPHINRQHPFSGRLLRMGVMAGRCLPVVLRHSSMPVPLTLPYLFLFVLAGVHRLCDFFTLTWPSQLAVNADNWAIKWAFTLSVVIFIVHQKRLYRTNTRPQLLPTTTIYHPPSLSSFVWPFSRSPRSPRQQESGWEIEPTVADRFYYFLTHPLYNVSYLSFFYLVVSIESRSLPPRRTIQISHSRRDCD